MDHSKQLIGMIRKHTRPWGFPDKEEVVGSSLLTWPSQALDISNHAGWMTRIVNVIARLSGATLPCRDTVDVGEVLVGALICADADRDDDVVHRTGVVDDRGFGGCLVAESGVDKASVNSGGDRRPGGRVDLGHGGMTAR